MDKAKMVMDVQVVERLQAGDKQAFQGLIERLQQPLIGYLHRLVGNREVALDLAQDTFLQVYKEIGKMPQDLLLDSWIYRIATNYGLRYLKRKRLREFVTFGSSSAPEDYDVNLMVPGPELQAEARILVRETLACMKGKDAACLLLHYGNDFTYEEISHMLEMTPEAVRKRVSRGVEKFRALYGTSSQAGKQQS